MVQVRSMDPRTAGISVVDENRVAPLIEHTLLFEANMKLEVDHAALLRCPAPGCNKVWRAAKHDTETERFPMLRQAPNGPYVCPAPECSYTSYNSRELYSHYAARSNYKQPNVPHPGKLYTAIPRNMLSMADLRDFQQHLKWEKAQEKRYQQTCCHATSCLVLSAGHSASALGVCQAHGSPSAQLLFH